MYLLLIYFSFFSFLFSFFGGRYLNNLYAGYLTSFLILINFLLSLFIFYEVAICQSPVYIDCGSWINVGLLEIRWIFGFDSLTATMLVVILSISMCAHFYSIEYMLLDPHQIKFMSYLSLFTFFMLLLVTSSNLIILFVGWEGVGISSYLLINFWHTRLSANKSAIMAMFVNKIGDISLLISFTLIYFLFYTFDFSILFLSISSIINNNFIDNNFLIYMYLIGLFFIIGAVGKSAQLGLHTWLPEAMEGPTPVSSLIHAATMVTAGIFLIIRCNLFFHYINDFVLIIVGLGSLTAFLGSTIGIFQLDVKKIIAYSTCSQLGYMFLACGLSGYQFSIYHLTNHAFFKALLFLMAGYIIHAMNNEQDIRKLGGLLFVLPFAYIGLNIGSLSLLGFPFFSGFFSKEKIIELFYSLNFTTIIINYKINIIFFFQFLASISVTFTILYSIKILVYIFFYNYNNTKINIISLHYSSYITIIPLFFLSILSIISGYLLEDMMVGFSSNLWNISILPNNLFLIGNINYFEFNLLSNKLPIISILYFICLFFILYYFYESKLYYLKISNKWTEIYFLFLNKKYIFLNKNIYYPIINLFFHFSYKSMYILFDKGIIELFGPFGIIKILNKTIFFYNKTQTGLIYHYFGIIILSFIFFIFIILSFI